jgi:hypothetical protein
MFAQLPLPYPDELLYSVIARYLTYFPPRGASSAVSALFGGISDAIVEFPRRLDYFADTTNLTWGMTSDQIINNHTLFPFYSHFVSPETSSKCVQSMKTGNPLHIHAHLGITCRVRRVEMPQFMRFCSLCALADIETLGETYWRRQHQLPGVIVCAEHGVALNQSTVLMRPLGPVFRDATQIVTTEQSSPLLDLNKVEIERAKLVAVCCNKFLSQGGGNWPTEYVDVAYRKAAITRGFHRGRTRADIKQLLHAITGFYGQKLLRAFGCPAGTRNIWMETIFQKHQQGFHPLQHALIQVFLDSCPEKDDPFSKFGNGPWRCPSPISDHSEYFPIKYICVRSRRSGGGQYAAARCPCGFSFYFENTSQNDPTLPIVKQVTNYGAQYQAKAKKMANDGFSIQEISKKLKIKYQLAHRLLRRPDTSQKKAAEILQLRKQWTNNRDMSAYQKLRLRDRNWLSTQIRRLDYSQIIKKRKKARMERLAIRDADWARTIPIAAAKIREMFPVIPTALKNDRCP